MENSIYRGDIYYADLSPTVGSEQGGVRPVLIIQNDMGNRHSPTVIVSALTSKSTKAKLPTHVTLPKTASGLPSDSTVLMEQVRTIDQKRLHGYIGHLNDLWMARMDRALCISMGIQRAEAEPERRRA